MLEPESTRNNYYNKITNCNINAIKDFMVFLLKLKDFHYGSNLVISRGLKELGTLKVNLQKDNFEFLIGNGDPNVDGSLSHITNLDTLTTGFGNGGEFQEMKNLLTIIYLYTFWEHTYRSIIAKDLGIDEIKLDIFGDIRIIRNCLIHEDGIITDENKDKLKILKTTSKKIILTNDDISSLFNIIFDELESIIN